ncbi:MAG: glycoside hydrolase [Candidatus Omnitrophica bacterium]|nr:glycoside hydrolase [Candidatus Omnitrophota bacterium]
MAQPLYVAFVWHMHQPYYRDLATGGCALPWVRLHAVKDYLDMVERLSRFPAIHQTFNLVPSLLDQLEEYLPPASRSDAFLDLSRKPAASLSGEEQRFLLRWFFLAHIERMIRPSPRYHDLLAKRGLEVRGEDWPRIQKRFHAQDYLDLQVWFNLSWIDPWLRRQEPGLAALEQKGAHFTEEEKGRVLDHQLALMARVIPAYREAARRGQVELTTSPYYHPILPLLCDSRAALSALPHLPLPARLFRHPDDARWQLGEALRRHQAAFGAPAAGVWPSEGSVSEETIQLAIEAGVRWVATDEAILWRTLKSARAPSQLYRPHLLRRKGGQTAIVFRDRELSDVIGFVYSQWDPATAVGDFLNRLGAIHQQFRSASQPALVTVILDGENAWEFYPNDGHEFLERLYGALAADERFRCVTVSEFLASHPVEQAESLPDLASGSWIDGNFATWIGHPEKNAAWALLAQARETLAPLRRDDPATVQAWRSLGIAEGSDWMWWFGDTHFSAQAEEFDQLFRTHLANVYRLAGLEPPAELQQPIRRRAAEAPHGPTGMLHPTIDGRETSYYEWLYAGRIDLTQQYAAIQRSEQCLHRLAYGFDETHHYFRLDLDRAVLSRVTAWAIELTLAEEVEVRIAPAPGAPPGEWKGTSGVFPIHAELRPAESETTAASRELRCALGRLLELAVPRHSLPLKPGEKLRLIVTLRAGKDVLERYPAEGAFELSASPADLEAQAWPV